MSQQCRFIDSDIFLKYHIKLCSASFQLVTGSSDSFKTLHVFLSFQSPNWPLLNSFDNSLSSAMCLLQKLTNVILFVLLFHMY